MASVGQKRTRLERVAALELPPGHFERLWVMAWQRNVLSRVGLALLAALILCAVVEGWNPPFKYRTGYVPSLDIVSTSAFSKEELSATDDAKDFARGRVRAVFSQNPERLIQLRDMLHRKLLDIASAATLKEYGDLGWQEFQPGPGDEELLGANLTAASPVAGTAPLASAVAPAFSPALPVLPTAANTSTANALPSGGAAAPADAAAEVPAASADAEFAAFRKALAAAEDRARFEKAVAAALAPFERHGLLSEMPRDARLTNAEEILVYRAGQPENPEVIKRSDVLIGPGQAVRENLAREIASPLLVRHVFAWLKKRLPETLTLDSAATTSALKQAEDSVKAVVVTYPRGHTLASAGQPLSRHDLHTLQLAYDAAGGERTTKQKLFRAGGATMIFFALLCVCGGYMRFRQNLHVSVKTWAMILVMTLFTAVLSWLLSGDVWRGEITPLLLFGMTIAIAFHQEMALLFCGALSAMIAMATGQGLAEFVVLFGVCTAVILQMGRIRSRAKLVYVGLVAGCVGMVLQIVTSLLDDQPFGQQLLADALRTGMWTLTAGFFMTGLLPFVESGFGVLTDLSLLELGDVAHPLLQELIRRAPATYNHSITVGSIAEAAAEGIGARGLLVRVGAYFHDIGKMLKPGYFVENQPGGATSLHESLLPAMSTLVIIAHIKDGADLGRQRHLPMPIIDLIEQHHGTMLVEYFFGRANEQKELDPNGGEVDEHIYRYPGPKPQTKEAGVLMLADAVEGASRALTDPTPARIDSLVRELAERRLQDGQFDESGLTLRELRAVQRSLVKSLTALYHGRIKYPEQRTA